MFRPPAALVYFASAEIERVSNLGKLPVEILASAVNLMYSKYDEAAEDSMSSNVDHTAEFLIVAYLRRDRQLRNEDDANGDYFFFNRSLRPFAVGIYGSSAGGI